MVDEEDKISRAGWGPGPWDNEPDRLEWRSLGYPCLIVRGSLGNLCGYVAVPPGHPWHGREPSDLGGVDVHGGITFTGPCQEGGHICHVAQPGEPDDVWWIGFDCAHYQDYMPASRGLGIPMFDHDIYRDLDYVKEMVNLLADQAHKEIA